MRNSNDYCHLSLSANYCCHSALLSSAITSFVVNVFLTLTFLCCHNQSLMQCLMFTELQRRFFEDFGEGHVKNLECAKLPFFTVLVFC